MAICTRLTGSRTFSVDGGKRALIELLLKLHHDACFLKKQTVSRADRIERLQLLNRSLGTREKSSAVVGSLPAKIHGGQGGNCARREGGLRQVRILSFLKVKQKAKKKMRRSTT